MRVLACLPRWPTRYGHLSLKKLPVGYASPSRQFFFNFVFLPNTALFIFSGLVTWQCAMRPASRKNKCLVLSKNIRKKSRGFLVLTLLPSSQTAKRLVFRKNTLKKSGGVFGDMPCARRPEKKCLVLNKNDVSSRT